MSSIIRVLGACVLVGCTVPLDDERASLGALERDCVVPPPAGVAAWGAPVSLEYPEGSLWLFESIRDADGNESRNVGAFVESADAACAGVDLVRDGSSPVSLLALTPDEMAANEARTDGRQLALVPAGGLVDGDRGYLYYAEVLLGPGFLDVELVGRGLCVFESGPREPCTRVVRDGSTLLWDANARSLDRGGFADGEFAFVYGCDHVAAFEDHCTVARVPIASIGDPDAYEYFHPFDGWIADPRNAGVIFENAGQVTVRRNAALAAFTAVEMDIWSSQVVVQRGSEASGAFDDPDMLFAAVAPESLFIGGGKEHAALEQEDGLVIHVSYFTNGSGAQGVHLASFRFSGDAR